jgi:uncharacterized repeat protein (TIGR03847 family)
MAGRIYNFEQPDRFVAGTIGQPGNRTFFLQAREGTRTISVALEKVQVGLLAERLSALLAEVRERGAEVPGEADEKNLDRAPLDEPISELFRVGTMAIIWDGDDETIVVEAREMTEVSDDLALEEATGEAEAGDEDEDDDEDDEDSDADVLRVQLDPAGALAFVARALEVVAAGRPPCPFCGQPLNPEGHICARRNGFMH